MKDINEFRIINEKEIQMITKSLSDLSPKIIEILRKSDYKLFISLEYTKKKNDYPRLFLIHTTSWAPIIRNLDKTVTINSGGIYFGVIKRGNVLISLEGAEFLYKNGYTSEERHIYLSEDAEKSILYGNDLLKKNMVEDAEKLPKTFKKNSLYLVINASSEVISLVKFLVNNSEFQDRKPNERIAINLIDKGYYLRKKQ